jgi:hypothetical protein
MCPFSLAFSRFLLPAQCKYAYHLCAFQFLQLNVNMYVKNCNDQISHIAVEFFLPQRRVDRFMVVESRGMMSGPKAPAVLRFFRTRLHSPRPMQTAVQGSSYYVVINRKAYAFSFFSLSGRHHCLPSSTSSVERFSPKCLANTLHVFSTSHKLTTSYYHSSLTL